LILFSRIVVITQGSDDVILVDESGAVTEIPINKIPKEQVPDQALTYSRDCEVRGHCMCKEMLVIPVNRVGDKKRKIGINGGPRRRRGTRGL
jgi:hypothetical protein